MPSIAILGAGKLGQAIAQGLVRQGLYAPQDIVLTRRQIHELDHLAQQGFGLTSDTLQAVQSCQVLLLCVLPQQLNALLAHIQPAVHASHTVISTVTGVSIADIRRYLGHDLAAVRAMPNTAIAIGASMTCIATDRPATEALALTTRLFEAVGRTLVIAEEQMQAATALCACGIAFFLRAIRAASQGGTEIGFHAEDALLMAAQTAMGAGALLLASGRHPEHEIDHVTSPRGCTIAGLNQMEHSGFSSALIKGITTSAKKAGELYAKD